MIYNSFSPKQLTAMTWWNRPTLRDKDGILCDGAIRSGKTVSMAVGFFLWSMATYENQVFGICGRTIGALRRNLIIHLADWLGDTFSVTEHRSENRITVRCGRKKNTYYLFGGQDETSYTLIQGITLAGVLLDEAALMPQSFVEQACARCSVWMIPAARRETPWQTAPRRQMNLVRTSYLSSTTMPAPNSPRPAVWWRSVIKRKPRGLSFGMLSTPPASPPAV